MRREGKLWQPQSFSRLHRLSSSSLEIFYFFSHGGHDYLYHDDFFKCHNVLGRTVAKLIKCHGFDPGTHKSGFVLFFGNIMKNPRQIK